MHFYNLKKEKLEKQENNPPPPQPSHGQELIKKVCFDTEVP